MSDYSCLSALQEEVDAYQYLVFVSLGVTLIASVIRSAKSAYFQDYPAVGAKIFYSFALLKAVLGIILIVKFPGCPQVCGDACTTVGHHYVYPIIVFLVAFLWFNLANRYRAMATAQDAVGVVDENSGMAETATRSKEVV